MYKINLFVSEDGHNYRSSNDNGAFDNVVPFSIAFPEVLDLMSTRLLERSFSFSVGITLSLSPFYLLIYFLLRWS